MDAIILTPDQNGICGVPEVVSGVESSKVADESGLRSEMVIGPNGVMRRAKAGEIPTTTVVAHT